MSDSKVRYARDYLCNVCGEQAVVFVGLNDPDAEEYPKCRTHADEWFLKLMAELNGIKYAEEVQINPSREKNKRVAKGKKSVN